MAFPTFSILVIFLMSLFPNPLNSSIVKPSLTSQKQPKSYTKPPFSFSTIIYNRHRHINQQSNNSAFSDSKVQMRLHPSTHNALVMVVGIGTNRTSSPMLRTEFLIDTGSSFTWLQANPCDHCYNQGEFPFYDRTASITYDPVHCEDEACTHAPDEAHPGCNSIELSPSTTCSYNLEYVDGANSSGIIGKETFYFPDVSLRMYKAIDYVPFGVGTSNYLQNQRGFTPGVAGFGLHGYGTILSVLGVKRFSHCFPREEDDSGVLSLGEEAKLRGERFQLTVGSKYYSAPLTNVFVAGEPVILEDDGTLPAEMEFDTGTSETYLAPQLVDAIEAAIKHVLRRFRAKRSPTNQLCYKITDMLSINLDLIAVTFEFHYSIKIDLFSYHIWEQYNNGFNRFFCLRLLRGSGLNIFGNIAMRDVNIGYTLYEDNLAMYFYHQPCWR